MANSPWWIKHAPKHFTELVQSSDAQMSILKWMREAKKGCLLLVQGRTGTGKAITIKMAAKSLGYDVVETSVDEVRGIPSANIFGKRNLIVLRDIDCTPGVLKQKLARSNCPVAIILTQFSLNQGQFYLRQNQEYFKSLQTVKMERMPLDCVLMVVRKLLRLEGMFVSEQESIRLVEYCDRDIRAVMSYLHLFSFSKTFPKIFRSKNYTLFSICNEIFKRKVAASELDTLYTGHVAKMCLNSYVEHASDSGSVWRVLEAYSVSSSLPPEYNFLCLGAYANCNAKYEFARDECPEVPKAKDPYHSSRYFEMYDRNINCMFAVEHLKKIIQMHKITDLSALDREILSKKVFAMEEKKVFKYKYKKGSSNSVKRDVSLSEVLRMSR